MCNTHETIPHLTIGKDKYRRNKVKLARCLKCGRVLPKGLYFGMTQEAKHDNRREKLQALKKEVENHDETENNLSTPG